MNAYRYNMLKPGPYPCLSVRQPWAWAIFHGKPIENRPRYTSHRGLLLIHASKSAPHFTTFRDWIRVKFGLDVPERRIITMGSIIGVVDLTDCKWADRSDGQWG